MNSKNAFLDPALKDQIASSLLSLKDQNLLNYKDILSDLEDIIIGSFNNSEDIKKWKRAWIKRIDTTAKLLNIQLYGNRNSKLNWTSILTKITNTNRLKSASQHATTTASTNSVTTKVSNRKKLSAEEKNNIKTVFDNLDTKKMWRLSTGTIVEMRMKEFATACNYEHPCHSLIFDPDDSNWENYFSVSELEEIRSYNQHLLEPFPQYIEEYISSFKKMKTILEINKHCFHNYFHPTIQHDLSWIQLSLNKASRLFIDKNTINFDGLTERDITFKFDFLISIFEYTDIKVNLGEISSNSVAIS
ncbi:unnamed protein product [Cunninghamella blakesleeana]